MPRSLRCTTTDQAQESSLAAVAARNMEDMAAQHTRGFGLGFQPAACGM
jgi:hypothetical protein